ncbi:MAG: choice-of-anchor B family protein [Planctomycetota bacterium]
MTRVLRRCTSFALAFGATALCVLSWLHAHQDDPKILDRQPPYVGAGYRTVATGSAPFSGGPPITFPGSGLALLSWVTLTEIDPALDNANSCWGYVSPSGREYALLGLSHGTAFFEVTNPGDPQLLTVIAGNQSLWRDMKVYGQYAYSVTENDGGIQVIDMGNIDNGVVTLVNTVTTGGSGNTHTLALNEVSGYLYRCGGSGNGLRIYDLSNPAAPNFVASWPDRYVHEAQIVSYTSGPYAGREIAFCGAGYNGGWVEPGLDIVDVTNKSSIFLVARNLYPGAVYCHQGWLSEDRQYFFVDDELDEQTFGVPTNTLVFNVSNLTTPQLVSTFSTGSTAIDHNQYVRGKLLYQANYRSGLHVWDTTNPLSPTEIANFDTYPPDDNANFNSLWNNYPFFPSGTIIGSDIEKGLFVWRLTTPLSIAYPLGTPTQLAATGGDVLRVQVLEASAGALLDGSVALHVDVGSGFATVSLTPISPLVFEYEFPALACATTVRYYVTVRSDAGAIITDPPAAPGISHVATVAGGVSVTFDALETAPDWLAGAPGDDAATGLWVLVDPNGTSAQPEDDHSNPGAVCWVTAQGAPGAADGAADVDSGTTTLRSPLIDLSLVTDASIGYWRWYSNSTGAVIDDEFRVDISSDSGANWVNVETIGPSGNGTGGGWIEHEFRVADFVPLTTQVQLRFVASDLGGGSIVEAAIDDFTVTRVACVDCNANGLEDSLEIAAGASTDCNLNGVPDSCDIAAGTSLDQNGDSVPDECACPILFVRGDTNGDGSVNVADAIFALNYLFTLGAAPIPLAAADVNNDGSVNVADAVYLLDYLFGSGPAPAAPFPVPGCP